MKWAFADEWATRTGATTTVAMEVGRFDLPTRPRVPFEVSGAFRPADGADTALVDDWHQQFVDTIEGGGRAASSLTRHVQDGRVGLEPLPDLVEPAGEVAPPLAVAFLELEIGLVLEGASTAFGQ